MFRLPKDWAAMSAAEQDRFVETITRATYDRLTVGDWARYLAACVRGRRRR
ncbi:hypothetical protein [Actinomycetospora sp. NBRC 106375]|uniref:hypothetical protein n=1 Tax=Actinomycetospora sp. NBRC 106375 TaxID=3032207 RepID=UPI002552F888|nr:hypothetical protein [Actinomycetospora sp. NBRC 106375]